MSPAALSELTYLSEPPRVTLTVASAPRGNVRVFYWDASGTVDMLAVAAGRSQVEVLAATLAAALLQRHLPGLSEREQRHASDEACERWENLLNEWRSHLVPIHGMRVVRRTYPITMDQF